MELLLSLPHHKACRDIRMDCNAATCLTPEYYMCSLTEGHWKILISSIGSLFNSKKLDTSDGRISHGIAVTGRPNQPEELSQAQ